MDKEFLVLEKCQKENKLCSVSREIIDYAPIYCYPIKITKALALVRPIYDFAPDGFKIIRTADITDVTLGEAEAFFDMAVKNEYEDINADCPDVCIDSVKKLASDLAREKTLITIECEEYEDSCFYAGIIEKTNERAIEFAVLDNTAKWYSKRAEIPYEDITCVSVMTRYLNVVSKYISAV